MFLHRLAAGLVFLAGVGLSRLGIAAESWPLLGLGLLAATLGLWHFLVGGTATAKVMHGPRRRRDRRGDGPDAPAADIEAADVRAGN